MGIEKITAQEYYNVHRDYKGIYEDFAGDSPQLKGRKTIMMSCITHEPNGGLGIEGAHFEIVGSYTPSAYELSKNR